MMASSCSTTTTVLPRWVSCFRMVMSLSISLECRPTEGSSRTKRVSTRPVPRHAVRLTRSTSPPERVLEVRLRVR